MPAGHEPVAIKIAGSLTVLIGWDSFEYPISCRQLLAG
jgi:hypothetical protein